MNFLASLENSPLGGWIQSSTPVYYVLLVGHAIGMGVVVGTVAMLCLRVLGFSKDQPLLQFEPLFRIAWAGFALNAMTGLCLFIANATNLVQNPPFLIKISFIVLGGLSMLLLWRRLMQERAVVVDANGAASGGARVLAGVTLGCWLMAIMAGRLIAYTIRY